MLKRGARALGPDVLDPERDLKVTKWHVEGDDDGVGAVDGSGGSAEYPDLEDIDAILLTGSSMSFLVSWERTEASTRDVWWWMRFGGRKGRC